MTMIATVFEHAPAYAFAGAYILCIAFVICLLIASTPQK